MTNDNLSLIDKIALLPDEDRDELIAKLTPDDLASAEMWLRPKQLDVINSSAWLTLMVAGRGAGKSRTGAHWIVEKAKTPGTRIALLGRTVADVRDVMVAGESGILAISSDTFMPEYMPSVRRLVWPNGSIASTFSSESPNQLRGPQQHYAWADELAAFKHVPDSSGLTAWDNLLLSTRLGETPQILATTTPKRTPIMRELMKLVETDPDRVNVIKGSTLDNKANLSEAYISQIYDMYAGTPLERQELFGEMLELVEGALWLPDDVIISRLPSDYRETCMPIISVDPGVTGRGDATGIVVVLTTTQYDINARSVWVCEDLTVTGPPEVWSPIVASAFERWSGGVHRPIVVVEGNQGYEMARTILMQDNPSMPIVLLHASKSKEMRAQPVSLSYKRGRVFHTKHLEELEQEMFDWEPTAKWSPNRMDAMVHGVRSAVIDPKPLRAHSPIIVGSVGARAPLNVVPSYRTKALPGLVPPAWRKK